MQAGFPSRAAAVAFAGSGVSRRQHGGNDPRSSGGASGDGVDAGAVAGRQGDRSGNSTSSNPASSTCSATARWSPGFGEPGTVVGDLGAARPPHSATVRARRGAEVHVVDDPAAFMDAHPPVARESADPLRLQKTTALLVGMRQQARRARTARCSTRFSPSSNKGRPMDGDAPRPRLPRRPASRG